MKVVTYLGFTLISILIQFGVMDLIQERFQTVETPNDLNTNSNGTSQRKRFSDILNEYSHKPHALYFRKQDKQLEKQVVPSINTQNNSSLVVITLEMESTTDASSTMFEIPFDENLTTTENTYTTDSMYVTTEFDNVTEFTLFERKPTSEVPTLKTKVIGSGHCNCNFLIGICDIDCCCDTDCTNDEQALFKECAEDTKHLSDKFFCANQLPEFNFLGDLFCIIKTNLPEKRIVHNNQLNEALLSNSYKWRMQSKPEKRLEFNSNYKYGHGDPIWLIQNGSIYHLEMPTLNVNDYCSNRRPMKFLQQQQVVCNVKVNNLEMFHFLETAEDSQIISTKDYDSNITALNCSTLHCTNWTVLVCEEGACSVYNKSSHEPSCMTNVCKHIALKLEYTFYYHNKTIVKATVKLHTQKLHLSTRIVSQEIRVRFVLSNNTSDNVIELSGNPGYLYGRPIIISVEEKNHTDHFYNTSAIRRHLVYPENKNGICLKTNVSNNLLFGYNLRNKCRLFHKVKKTLKNNTETCRRIQEDINLLLGLSSKTYVSPLGDPLNVKDTDWIPLQSDSLLDLEAVFGQINQDKLLQCINVFTRISIQLTFMDESNVEHKKSNKIMSVRMEAFRRNVTFNIEDNVSTVITVDVNFIDVTKQNKYEFAGRPDLDIHLPKDFFFPFPSKALSLNYSKVLLLFTIFVIQIKTLC